MAPTSAANDEQFRFIVKIMPPRRPKNSLFSRLQQPKVDEPLHTIAVPARPSESFADVWKHIRERYHRNYGKEEVAKAWFHKLQDRFGADIDSHDGVGALGYNSRTPKEDLVLVMLQNDIDRDGSVPETSGLRPPGFSRPELSAEQALEVKRRKDQEERYGAALEDVDEDTPIDSRERSQGPGSSQLGEDTANAKRIDADGFAVPTLPGSITRKRKRTRKSYDDIIQSSIDEENEDNVLVPGSQTTSRNIESVPNSFPDEPPASRSRSMRSMPADAASGASQRDHHVNRSRTAAPSNQGRRTSAVAPENSALQEFRLASLEAEARSLDRHTRNDADRPKSPPTPVSGVSQPVTQQPPESAQRPKQSQGSTSVRNQPHIPSAGTDEVQNDDDFDPIEDDDLLSGIGGTADNDYDEYEFAPEEVPRKGIKNRMLSVFSKTIPGKLKKPNKLPTSTPKSSGIHSLSGTQGSASKNPRSQSAGKNLWSVEEDSYILKGNRRGLNAAQIIKEFGLQDRSTSAVRGRHKILLAKNPELAYQRGVSEVPSEVFSNGPPSSRKRQAWPPGDIQIMSRAIANGYDSLEIQASHFPTRSEDAVARKVLAIQDGIWKSAAKSKWFPENRAQLEGWTLKDSCKLRRTFRENLPTQDAKNRFFGRWEMSDVQRQLNAYKAQVKEIAAQQGRSMESARYDEDFLNASSQLPVNSSPVERSVQARAARRTSGDALRHRTLELGSSPPQQHANGLESQTVVRSSAPARRGSSPRVEISSSEQENARNMLSLPPSGSGGQTTLNLTRDKGKKRAGAARPTDEELDAQYTRRATAVNSNQPATQPQCKSSDSSIQPNKTPAKDDLEEHTPMDDLDMLDAQLDTETQPTNQEKPSRTIANEITGPFTAAETIEDESTPRRTSRVSQKSPLNAKIKVDMQTPGKVATHQNRSTAHHITGDNVQIESDRRSLLSPMETTGDRTPTTLSEERRRSRHQSGVDTRAAMQLSQELQRSLSSEEVEEAAQESQAFQTQDPATSRSQRIAAASKTVRLTKDNILPSGDASRSVNPVTSAFHRTSPRPAIATQAPKASQSSQHHVHAMEPSPRAGASKSNITPATTPGTTPARSGRLPARGQSYASRIRDLQRSNKPFPSTSSAEQDETSKEVTKAEESRVESRDERSPSPTDASIWEKTANAAELGKNREEYFQDLRISTYSVRAMARGDWNEVQRLKAEERRLRRQRKLANGESTFSQQVHEHQDGPATGGDGEQADEDVIRADDYSRESSEAVDDDGDEKIWSDNDHEQPEEMDRERHFSEVKDDDEVANPDAETAPEEVEEAPDAESDHPVEPTDNQEMLDPVEAFHEPEGQPVAQEEKEDDLELPTVATLPETNGDVRHALTDDNLQELNNSGAEGSPARLSRKRKANEVEATPSSKRDKPQTDDKAAMPPPQSNKPMSKRGRRRKRAHRRHSESGSERSSSVSRQMMSSDGPQQHTPFTPINKWSVGHKAKKAKLSETTPDRSPEVSRATSTQRAAGASQGASVEGSQRVNGVGGGGLSGLSGLVRKAHIPTPPRKKETPKAEQKSRKFDIRKEDDESESSADSD